jgi:putative uncharacterized protein (fragment)
MNILEKNRLIKTANALSKEGNYFEAIKIFKSLDVNHCNDIEKNLYGWAIYRFIKNTENLSINDFKHFLFDYLKLDLPKPSLLHSLILIACLKFLDKDAPDNFNFINFIKIWGINSFRDDDFISSEFKNTDGKTIKFPCLASNMLRKCAQYALKQGGYLGDMKPLMAFYLEALKRIKNDIWLQRDCALILNKLGKNDEAAKIYKDLFKELSGATYYWGEFGDFFFSSNVDLAIGMYSKALLSKNDEIFIVNIRMKLATLLIKKGEFSRARFELEKYKQTKQHLDKNFFILYNNVKNYDPSASNTDFYKRTQAILEEYLYTDLKVVDCVFYDSYTDANTNARYCCFTDFNETNFKIKENKLKNKNLNLLSCYGFKVIDGKPIEQSIKPSDKQISDLNIGPAFKKVGGKITIKSKDDRRFGFLKNIYIPQKFLEKFNITQDCLAKMVYKFDPKTKINRIIYIQKER